MKFFTKQSSKAVAKRFVLLFLTMLAFGFTANAQIPTFNEILKRYYNPQDLVVRATAQTPPYGQQFENYTFEEWETVSGSSVEPKNWNSFMTADGKSSLKKYLKDQISKSTEKRPGSTGSYSARVFSSATNIIITKIIANGNMTNGQIYAGNTTANNDGNYNFTKRSDSNFNTPLTAIPDSLTVWVAFKPKSASKGNARITTTLHGDTDLKQLAKSGDSPADMVCATANQEIAATSTSAVVWKRVTIPFTKGSHNDPRYILATFNTNATPGGGSEGDELYVDDICLIYKPTLNVGSIAQTEYNVSNTISANITVPFTLDGSMSVYNLNKADNEVIAQLSDANGSFANPIELGRMTTNVSGTIEGAIPAGTPSGTGYRVRVVSTNYPMTSDDNGTNLIVNLEPYVPQVKITRGEVLTKSVSAAFAPNVDCSKYYIMIAKSSETVNADYVKANGTLKTGNYSHTWSNLISNTNYNIYVLPIDLASNAGKLSTLAVKTQAFVPQVNIERGNVAAKSITATFTPTNADCAEYYFMIAPATQSVDAAYVKANGTSQTGTFTKIFENLTSNTAYKIYALPVDVDDFNGELKTLDVTTQALVPQTTVTVGEVATKSATVTFAPNADCVEYYFMIAPATETVDAAKVKEGEPQTASSTKIFEKLISNTDYVLYVLSIDAEGNGPLSTTSIKTQAFVPQVNIERGNVAAKSITATFTPNADCAEYYFMIAPATQSVDAAYVKANGTSQTGTFTKTFENLTSNTAYKVYALPVDVDDFNGELKTLDVTTQALVPQTTVTVGEVATKSATVTFAPNADCVEYYFVITTETVDAAYVKANGEVKTEAHTVTFENLISNTAYTVYVLPIDVEGTEGALVTTAVNTLAFVPQVDMTKGKVAAKSITVTFTPTNDDCAEYYFLISTETVDAAYIKANGEKQTAVFTKTFENLTSNTSYTIYALPVDVDGFYGELKSETIKTKELKPQTTVTVGEILTKSATVTFAPNADCVEYYFMIAPATEPVDAAKVKKGEKQEDELTTTFEDLISNTDYVIYVLSVDVEGTESALSTTPIKTQAFVPQVNNIERGKVLAKSITATFTPNADCTEYYFMITEDEVVDASIIKANGEKQTATFKKTFENLTSNTSYTIYALPVDVDGFYGEIKSVTIKTSALKPQVTMTKDEALTYSMTISFESNADCARYYVLVEKSTATVDAAYVKKHGELKEGAFTKKWEKLSPSTNYTVFVLPIDIEDKEGELNSSFVVKTRVEAGKSEVDIDIEKLSYTSAAITATPNESTVLYHYIVIEKAEADTIGEDALMQRLNENVNYIDSIVVVDTMAVESNVAYYVVAQGKNRDDKWGEPTTEEFVVAGPAAVEVAVKKLNETKVSVTATPNENTVSYHYIVIEKAEADTMSEAALMQRLEASIELDKEDTMERTVKSNVEYYVIAQAVNTDGMTEEMTPVEFTVAGPATVAVEVKKLNETTVSVTATPKENTVAYHYIIIAKAEADSIGGDALMQRLAENENYLEGVDTTEYEIESNVAYYVVAQGKNRDDKWGKVTKEEFVVAGPAVVEVAVKKLNETKVSVTATPNENTVSYHYIVIEKAEADTMSEAALMQRLEASIELDKEDTMERTVKSNVEYYVIAQAVNTDGMTGEMTQVEFTVAGPATVAVEVKKLNETTVNVAATPNENAVEYSYIIIAKAEADAMTPEEIAERLNASENVFEAANTKEHTIESNVAYYVIAQAVNADDMSGVITKVEFTVAGPAAVEIAVEKLTETTVSVTATPNENAISYHYIVIEKAEADEATLMQRLEASNELKEGETWTYTVKSNVEYYVIAQGKNADDMVGEMTQVEFTVAGPATIAIVVEEVSDTTVSVVATPNENAVAYHYIVIEKAEADSIGEDALMQRLSENENYLEGANTAELTIESNVAYYVVAQAKNADGRFGVVTKVEFIVEVAGPATIAIAVEELSKTSVSVTATPNENTVAYHYIIIAKAEADSIGEEALMQRLAENENYLKNVDVCTWPIESNVAYYVVAQAKNADDRWGEVTKVEFIVEEAGPATVAIAVEKVSDSLVAIVATPNENAVAYHYIVIEKADADTIGEDALMQRLAENENYLEGVDTTEYVIEANVEYYVVAQAVNADSVFGEVTMVEFVITEDNPGDDNSVEEFNKLAFEIYPNPAIEYVRIKSNSEIESLVIYSIDGKVVYSEDVNQEETMINVAGFAKGSYLVKMLTNGEVVVKRIIVK